MNMRDNGILDEELPTLLEHVFKCLSKNLDLVYTENLCGDEIKLRDDIVIPNVICDRFVSVNHQMCDFCFYLLLELFFVCSYCKRSKFIGMSDNCLLILWNAQSQFQK